jgi:hypothetical protein
MKFEGNLGEQQKAKEETAFTGLPYEDALKEVRELEMWAKATDGAQLKPQFEKYLKAFNDEYGEEHGAYEDCYADKESALDAVKEYSHDVLGKKGSPSLKDNASV